MEYALFYNGATGAFSVIQRDYEDSYWHIYPGTENLTENVATVVIKGLLA